MSNIIGWGWFLFLQLRLPPILLPSHFPDGSDDEVRTGPLITIAKLKPGFLCLALSSRARQHNMHSALDAVGHDRLCLLGERGSILYGVLRIDLVLRASPHASRHRNPQRQLGLRLVDDSSRPTTVVAQ